MLKRAGPRRMRRTRAVLRYERAIGRRKSTKNVTYLEICDRFLLRQRRQRFPRSIFDRTPNLTGAQSNIGDLRRRSTLGTDREGAFRDLTRAAKMV